MKNAFIVKGEKYIRKDVKSLLLYYDYFSPGIQLPKIINFRIAKFLTHKLLRTVIVLMFIFKFYKMFLKEVLLDDDAILIIKARGTLKNVVRLVESKRGYKVIKDMSNGNLNEEKFYKMYKKNHSKIFLPKSEFISKNVVRMEFIQQKTFHRLILEGRLSLQDSIEHFLKIKNQLKIIHKDNLQLIHGDFCPINILLNGDIYYAVDFSDAHQDNYKYDLYTLLYSILLTHRTIPIGTKSIADINVDGRKVQDLIGVNKKELTSFEIRYEQRFQASEYIYEEEKYSFA